MGYSAFSILKNAFSGNRNWQPVWRTPEPKPHYDVIIVGGGGHGLATAYYLAKEFGIRNVAVVEKGWIGSGNAGRNTTIVRSNYNTMVSQRGVLNLCHTDAQRDAYARRGNAMRLNGVDAELLDRAGVARM